MKLDEGDRMRKVGSETVSEDGMRGGKGSEGERMRGCSRLTGCVVDLGLVGVDKVEGGASDLCQCTSVIYSL